MVDLDLPFLRLDAANYSDMFTDALVEVLAHRGLDQFSVGAIARWLKVTPQAVLQQAGGRDRLVVLVTDCFAERWLQWSTRRRWGSSPSEPLGALPETAHERLGVRVWQVLAELARSESLAGRTLPSELISATRTRERQLLTWSLRDRVGREPEAWEVDAAFALVEGLRSGLARESEPLPIERGQEAIANWLSTTNWAREG